MSFYLCDYPVGDRKTCDRPLCQLHAHPVAKDRHTCPDHVEGWHLKGPGRQLSLFADLVVVK